MAGQQFQDFLIDSATGDLLIQNGDFVVGPSDNQHINDIISCFAGSFKQFPQIGVGIMTFLKSQNGKEAVNEIKQQLQADGYQLGNVKVVNDINGLKIDFPQGITRNV